MGRLVSMGPGLVGLAGIMPAVVIFGFRGFRCRPPQVAIIACLPITATTLRGQVPLGGDWISLTLRNGNGYLAWSNSDLTQRYYCSPNDGGTVVAWSLSHATSTGLYSIGVQTYVAVSGVGTVMQSLRLYNYKFQYLSGGVWVDVPVGTIV